MIILIPLLRSKYGHINVHPLALPHKLIEFSSTAATDLRVSVFSDSSDCRPREQQVLRRLDPSTYRVKTQLRTVQAQLVQA